MVDQRMQSDRALLDIQAERLRQLTSLGYDNEHDDAHSSWDFCTMFEGYIAQIGANGNDSPDENRAALVKIGALAVAAIEALDRKG